jgi:ribosomal protein S18 acetylase RimI-like enzyme
MKIKQITEDGKIVQGVNTTVDVKPGETKRQSEKFGNKLNDKNEPPLLNAKARKNSSPHVLSNIGLAEAISTLNVGKDEKLGFTFGEPEGKLVGRTEQFDVWYTPKSDQANAQLWQAVIDGEQAGFLASDNSFNIKGLNAKTIQTTHTAVSSKHEGKRIVVSLYLWMLDQGYALVSDGTQTVGGRKIWQRMAKTPGVNVYAVDFKQFNDYDDLTYHAVDPNDISDSDTNVYNDDKAGLELVGEIRELQGEVDYLEDAIIDDQELELTHTADYDKKQAEFRHNKTELKMAKQELKNLRARGEKEENVVLMAVKDNVMESASPQSKNGIAAKKVFGYKAMNYDPDTGEIISGADSRVTKGVKLRKDMTLRMPAPGIFMSTNREYIETYYAGNNDHEALIKFEVDPAQLTSGNLTDRENEFTVLSARVVGFKILDNINEGAAHDLASALKSKHQLKDIWLSDLDSRNAIEVSSIIVDKENQRQGTGTAVMQEIVKYADENGKILVLDPAIIDKKHGTTSQSRLRKFYKRFGFIDNKGRNKNYEFRSLMIRYPTKINEATQLTELFNDVYNWQWSGKTTKVTKAQFNTDDGGFVEVFFERLHPDSPNYEAGFKKNGEIKRSGEGDQFKIIATVIDVMKAFLVKNTDTEVLTFIAKREGRELESPKMKNRRAALYKRLLDKFADKLGFEFSEQVIGRMTEFVLRKKDVNDAANKVIESRQLNELFDQPYTWNWKIVPDGRQAQAVFTTHDDKPVHVGFAAHNDEVEVDFTKNFAFGATDEGDQFRIFATVMQIISDYVSKDDPKVIAFSAEKNPNTNSNSRSNLYKRMVAKFAQKINMNFKAHDGEQATIFKLTKNNMQETIKKPHPKDTLGVKRHEMPQVHSSHYPELLKYLASHGGKFKTYEVSANALKSVQGEFSDAGVERMIQQKKDGAGSNHRKPIIISSDNYIIDGHHRWLAAWNQDLPVLAMQVSLPVKQLLKLVKDFKHTTYKDIYEAPAKTDSKFSVMELALMEGGHNIEDINELKDRSPTRTSLKANSSIIWHQTGSKAAKLILQHGFDTGINLSKGEGTGAIFFTSWKPTGTNYTRGEKSARYIPVDTSGMNLLDTNNLLARTDITDKSINSMIDKGIWDIQQASDYQYKLWAENGSWDQKFDGIIIRSISTGLIYEIALSKKSANTGLDILKTKIDINENISIIGTERHKQERKKNLQPGTEAWFKHWFSLPKMRRGDLNRLKEEVTKFVKDKRGVQNEKTSTKRRLDRNRGTDERGRHG